MRILILIAVYFTCTPSHALEIRSADNNIYLSGEIQEYDDKAFSIALTRVMLDHMPATERRKPIIVHLDIPNGGLADVSFKIAGIIETAIRHGETTLITRVPGGKTCMSGCTFIFLSGAERQAAADARFIFHGFNYAPSEVPQHVVEDLASRYRKLLRKTDPAFFRFFETAHVIESNRYLGFTGETLFSSPAFSNVVTKIIE